MSTCLSRTYALPGAYERREICPTEPPKIYKYIQKLKGKQVCSMKPVIIRALYRKLTNDASTPTTLHKAEIDERMRMILEMQVADIVVDLRHLNSGRKTCYIFFWSECKKFLDKVTGSPVDDRKCHTLGQSDFSM